MKAAYMDVDWSKESAPYSCDEMAFHVDDDLLWLVIWVDAERRIATMSSDTWDTLAGRAAVAVTDDFENATESQLVFLDHTKGVIAQGVFEWTETSGESPVVDAITELTRRVSHISRLLCFPEGEDINQRAVAARLKKLRAQLLVVQARLARLHKELDFADAAATRHFRDANDASRVPATVRKKSARRPQATNDHQR